MSHEKRIPSFKNYGKDIEECRRRRAETTVELRKAKKSDQLSKKRNIGNLEDFVAADEMTLTDSVDNDGLDAMESPGSETFGYINEETLQNIIANVFSEQVDYQIFGMKLIQQTLDQTPPEYITYALDSIISVGIVPRCIQLLQQEIQLGGSVSPKVYVGAAWTLAKIVSGNSYQTDAVTDVGGVELFVKLLNSSSRSIVEQAVWALGNIAEDGTTHREHVISAGVVKPLIELSKIPLTIPILRNVAWTISKICKGKHSEEHYKEAKELLPTIAHLIMLEDDEIILYAARALSFLSDGNNDRIEDVLSTGTVPRLVQLLTSDDIEIVRACLRSVGNIVTGTYSQTQLVLQNGLIPALPKLIQSNVYDVRNDALWTTSNICAGTNQQIREVINGDLLPFLIEALLNGSFTARKEAAWCISNITCAESAEFVEVLANLDVIPALAKLLEIEDAELLMVVLESIENILTVCANADVFLEECGGLRTIEDLQYHQNDEISRKAANLTSAYNPDEESVNISKEETAQPNQPIFKNVLPMLEEGTDLTGGGDTVNIRTTPGCCIKL